MPSYRYAYHSARRPPRKASRLRFLRVFAIDEFSSFLILRKKEKTQIVHPFQGSLDESNLMLASLARQVLLTEKHAKVI